GLDPSPSLADERLDPSASGLLQSFGGLRHSFGHATLEFGLRPRALIGRTRRLRRPRRRGRFGGVRAPIGNGTENDSHINGGNDRDAAHGVLSTHEIAGADSHT